MRFCRGLRYILIFVLFLVRILPKSDHLRWSFLPLNVEKKERVLSGAIDSDFISNGICLILNKQVKRTLTTPVNSRKVCILGILNGRKQSVDAPDKHR